MPSISISLSVVWLLSNECSSVSATLWYEPNPTNGGQTATMLCFVELSTVLILSRILMRYRAEPRVELLSSRFDRLWWCSAVLPPFKVSEVSSSKTLNIWMEEGRSDTVVIWHLEPTVSCTSGGGRGLGSHDHVAVMNLPNYNFYTLSWRFGCRERRVAHGRGDFFRNIRRATNRKCWWKFESRRTQATSCGKKRLIVTRYENISPHVTPTQIGEINVNFVVVSLRRH